MMGGYRLFISYELPGTRMTSGVSTPSFKKKKKKKKIFFNCIRFYSNLLISWCFEPSQPRIRANWFCSNDLGFICDGISTARGYKKNSI